MRLAALLLLPAALAAQETTWTRCDLREPGDGKAECATVSVPLYHANPGLGTLPLAVKRVPARAGEYRALWFVDGGPGDAGRASLGKVAGVFAGDSGLAIYTFDHCGVGGSAPLECPEQRDPKGPDGAELTPKEWAPCIEHLKATRPDLRYGSFLVWEYLRIAAEQPTGVILDGIVPPDWSFAEFDAGLDLMGRRWLGLCATDSTCAARTGGDPARLLRVAADSLASGPCRKTGLSPAMFRLVEGNLLMAGDPIRRGTCSSVPWTPRC